LASLDLECKRGQKITSLTVPLPCPGSDRSQKESKKKVSIAITRGVPSPKSRYNARLFCVCPKPAGDSFILL
jgi:hypothetical protein